MHIYAQHGYAKATKIEVGLREGSIRGVIMGPRNERPERMSQYISNLRDEFNDDVVILFDPQFYVTTLPDATDGNLLDYPYYRSRLTRANFTSPTDLHSYAAGALEYQLELGVDRLISPTALFNDFSDPWSQIALSSAQEAMLVHQNLPGTPPPLLLSLAIDDAAFGNRDGMDEFLHIISLWDVAGFYLLIQRTDTTYPAQLNDYTLANLIKFVHGLAELNDFEVICGYSDLAGLALHAVGALATGTGWFNTLRQFSLARFQPSTGGRPANARYTSQALMNSILVLPELAAIAQAGMLDQVLSNSARDAVFSVGIPPPAWPLGEACLQHWEVLEKLASEVSSQGSTSANLTLLQGKMEAGLALYAELSELGVPFEAATGPGNLQKGLDAIQSFRGSVNL